MAIPTIMSMILTILYNMADTFSVDQAGKVNQMVQFT